MSRAKTTPNSMTTRGLSKRPGSTSANSSSVRRQQHHQQQLLKPMVQAIPEEFVDLSGLTPEERDHIQAVLDRDAEIRRREQDRVVKLKKDIRELRTIRAEKVIDGDTSDTCARCPKKFGLVFNRPRVCVVCSRRVCSKCSQQIHKPYQEFYICSTCVKQIELESMTGQWFELLQAAKAKKVGRKMTASAGADIIYASLKRARTQEDGGGVDDVDARSSTGTANGRLVGAQSKSSRASSGGGHGSDEENEDIGDMFDRYGGVRKKSASQSNLERLSPFSSSKESIVSMYSNAGSESFGKFPVSGEIEFGLSYNYKQSTLEVHIKQCRNIHAVDTKRNSSDSYVKTYLLPDKTKNGKRKTRVKKHTTSPVFDEVVKYHVTKSELESRTLCVMVWNNDRFGRNDFLGEVNVSFDHHSFDDQSPKWYRLQDRPKFPIEGEVQNLSSMSMLTYKGDLNVCLRFVSSETLAARKQAVGAAPDGVAAGHGNTGSDGNGVGELHVVVKQARNLTPVRANGHSDPFCKCNLLPDRSRHGTQKSPVIKRNCNPNWNHTFVFENVSWNDLRERSLELTIWDHDRLVSNDFLGGVRLNLGTGRSSSDPVDWMDSKGEEISLWQAMLDRPNCWIEGTLLLRVHMGQRQ